MNRNDLKIIKGGCRNRIDGHRHVFESAYVTDTRLMGVVGLHIHWIMDTDFDSDLHQFFYFDAEEYGLETYKSYIGTETLPLTLIEKAIIGGLGGKKMDLTERQACFLVQHFAQESRHMNVPLAEPVDEYMFILKNPVKLTDNELDELSSKLCTRIRSSWELIHYFLMRTFGHDKQGASYLLASDAEIGIIAESKPATLCKNTIEDFVNPDGSISYLSESLVELEDHYKMVLSEITVAEDQKICTAVRRSAFSVTTAEVAMLLNRAEFITLFEILIDPDEFDRAISDHTAGSLQTLHENGKLFLEFNRNNDHVNRRVFRLNEDVHGLYYISDFGQMLLAAYSLEDIRELEARLNKSTLSIQMVPTAKYEFKEPILYEFIQSGFEDFNDFLETVQLQ